MELKKRRADTFMYGCLVLITLGAVYFIRVIITQAIRLALEDVKRE